MWLTPSSVENSLGRSVPPGSEVHPASPSPPFFEPYGPNTSKCFNQSVFAEKRNMA
jgi:hypothetical protein